MAAKQPKERIDKLMVTRGLAPTRAKAQAYLMAGDVRVNGERMTKAGMKVLVSAEIEVTAPQPFVSRGGFKLAGALDTFGLDPKGRACADVGACTGGFTDVLLQRDAASVIAIDVGYGQLDWKIRTDPRVEVIERTNARYLEALSQPVSLVVIDVSFISLRLILPAVKKWLTPDFDIVTLVKPQFEAGREQVGRGGIIKDPKVHRDVLKTITSWTTENGLYTHGLTRSSIQGTDGNVEFLAWLRPDPADLALPTLIDALTVGF